MTQNEHQPESDPSQTPIDSEAMRLYFKEILRSSDMGLSEKAIDNLANIGLKDESVVRRISVLMLWEQDERKRKGGSKEMK